MSNPFKVGDKVRHRNADARTPAHEVLAVHGESLWVQFPNDPVTVRANHYEKAEEPITPGDMWWRKDMLSIPVTVLEVSARYVIYSAQGGGACVRTIADFREVYNG